MTVTKKNPTTTDSSQTGQDTSLGASERQRLQQQYAEIATLAGGLAHEIRNPLSTISMNLELLVEDLEHTESQRERRMLNKIQRVQRECDNLEAILNAFLQFARAGELELESSDINAEVTSFIRFYEPLAQEHGVELTPHLATDLPPVLIDRSLMRQVWMNLVQNAQQAMPEGGQIVFQTRQQDGQIHVELIDNGCGMDERVRSKMFQAFFSTKSNGSGLGLPTVRKIVEAHNGTIRCESEPGKGTRFTITLPAAE